MTDNTDQDRRDVERLLELSCTGPDALADLERAVRRLQDVQAAKVALAGIPSEAVRWAITQRRERLADEGSQG
ncbi:hypothetical protein MWU75_15365 [Ornithinimicrobium sp. F0845]|uniref:hypothetical protein n=1 Tax=Ornithinimicrobium sp. F0845 TaxID=2926412 RepID=UPI001FF1BB5D|nr:hypothetical protein [Ornithinimicrobium sp. F0845]MCK0113526.1 hypothetical protein [Ornithinimicrobium sp. F0845]